MSTQPEDRSVTDPTWPKDYPAQVLHDYNVNPNPRGATPSDLLSVRKNDRVKIISEIWTATISGQECELAQAVYPTSAKPGTIPVSIAGRRIVNIGKRAKVTEPFFLNIVAPPRKSLAWRNADSSTSRLSRTTYRLISQIYHQRETIIGYNVALNDLNTSQARQNVYDEFIEAFESITLRNGSNLRQRLDKEFTIRQLLDEIPPIQNGATNLPWTIYLLAHFDFHGNLVRLEIYIGKSTRPGLRLVAHLHAKTDPTTRRSCHYSAARHAQRTVMIPLMQFQGRTKWLFLAEQLCVCLFRSYCPQVFISHNTTRDLNIRNGNSHKLAHLANAALAARRLTEIAEDVFKKTGWPQQIYRGDPYGAPPSQPVAMTSGFNYSSPITENNAHEKVRYTRITLEGKGFVFHRPPLFVRQTRHFKALEFEFSLPEDIPLGTLYYVAFELTENGSPHSQSYIRLPKMFGTSDRDKAVSWAVRVDWQEGGQWYRYYLYSAPTMRKTQRHWNRPCAFAGYKKGIQIYHWLRQGIIQPPDDMLFLALRRPNPGIRLTLSDFDQPSWTVTIRQADDSRQLSTQEGPRYLSDQEIFDMTAQLATGHTTVGGKPAGFQGDCDGCRERHGVCAFTPGDEKRTACITCWDYGHLCTWTQSQHFNGSELQRAYQLPQAVMVKQILKGDPGHLSIDEEEEPVADLDQDMEEDV